ncbi:hypothetical protein GCM10027586_06190 [Kineococcus gypseus]|uniref:hypothetical protein n=1 Tax=Kineococcus gypseus TaxID=1637102 RepID=UPI003D7C5F42
MSKRSTFNVIKAISTRATSPIKRRFTAAPTWRDGYKAAIGDLRAAGVSIPSAASTYAAATTPAKVGKPQRGGRRPSWDLNDEPDLYFAEEHVISATARRLAYDRGFVVPTVRVQTFQNAEEASACIGVRVSVDEDELGLDLTRREGVQLVLALQRALATADGQDYTVDLDDAAVIKSAEVGGPHSAGDILQMIRSGELRAAEQGGDYAIKGSDLREHLRQVRAQLDKYVAADLAAFRARGNLTADAG